MYENSALLTIFQRTLFMGSRLSSEVKRGRQRLLSPESFWRRLLRAPSLVDSSTTNPIEVPQLPNLSTGPTTPGSLAPFSGFVRWNEGGWISLFKRAFAFAGACGAAVGYDGESCLLLYLVAAPLAGSPSDQLIPPLSIDKPATRTYWSNTPVLPLRSRHKTGFLRQTNRICSEAEGDFPRPRVSAVLWEGVLTNQAAGEILI